MLKFERLSYTQKQSVMEKAKIAGHGPIPLVMKKGEKKAWCSCGRSKNQPLCDGSHVGSSFKPLIFEAEKDGKAFLCTCKQTKNPPYCDGSHTKL